MLSCFHRQNVRVIFIAKCLPLATSKVPCMLPSPQFRSNKVKRSNGK